MHMYVRTYTFGGIYVCIFGAILVLNPADGTGEDRPTIAQDSHGSMVRLTGTSGVVVGMGVGGHCPITAINPPPPPLSFFPPPSTVRRRSLIQKRRGECL